MMDDFIRAFFGHPSRRGGMMRDDDEEEGAWTEDADPAQPGGVIFQFDVMFDEMIKGMDDMMRGIDESFRHMQIPHSHPPGGHRDPGSGDLRDRMLKEGEQNETEALPMEPRRPWVPFGGFRHGGLFSPTQAEKRDEDLDNRVDSIDIKSLFKNKQETPMVPVQPQPQQQPWSHSFGSSTIYSYTQRPDGSIEERSTVRDSSGKEETRVTRSYDDKKHTVVTTKGADGQEQVTEQITDVDKDHRFKQNRSFGNEFNMYRSPGFWDNFWPKRQQPSLPSPTEPLDKEKPHIFEKLFGDYFKK